MHTATAVAIGLELGSATLVNLAYVREQEAASALPELSLRRPLASLRLLLTNRRWLGGFAMENIGFALYVAALALAPLAIVQTVGAAGIGLLALASGRASGRGVTVRERWGALVSLAGLAFLGLSLTRAAGEGGGGSAMTIVVWLGATGLVAAAVARLASRRRGVNRAAFYGVAAGLLFSVGDITTKVVTQGGLRILFAPALIAGYVLGTSMLQLGYQSGSALTTAGVATLLTNALPIAAGTALLGEPVPSGALGVVRVVSFGAVVAGGVLLSRPQVKPPTTPRPL